MSTYVSGRIVNSGSSNVSSQSLLLPGGWAPGDIAIWCGATNSLTPTLSFTSGWTFLDSTPFSASSARIWVAWQRLTASSSSPTVTLTGGTCKATQAIALYRGVSSTAAPIVGTSYSRPSSLATTAVPGVTTTEDGQTVVTCYLEKSSSASSATDPAGTTRRLGLWGSGGGQVSSLIVDAVRATAGATGTRTATYNVASTVGFGITLALADAPPASPEASRLAYTLTSGSLVAARTYRMTASALI